MDGIDQRSSTIVVVLYILLRLSPYSHEIHDICHATYAARPFLSTLFKSNARQSTDAPEELLKADVLYRECAVVNRALQWLSLPTYKYRM